MRKAMVAIGFGLMALTACSGAPVIADMGQDKVHVLANGASEDQVQAKANEACAMYKRKASTAISHRCGDTYCINKVVLYACTE